MTDYLYIWLLVILAWVATDMWRLLGIVLANRVAPESLAMKWINGVAYAMVCGVMMQVLVQSPGALAETSAIARFLALAISLALMLWRRNMPLAVASGAVGFFVLETVLRV